MHRFVQVLIALPILTVAALCVAVWTDATDHWLWFVAGAGVLTAAIVA